MTVRPIDIPLASGQSEAIDAKLLSPPTLRSLKNARFAKEGRVVKRTGYSRIVSPSARVLPDCLVEHNSELLAPRQRKLSSVVSNVFDEEYGHLSMITPGERRPVSRDASNQIQQVDVLVWNGYINYCWVIDTATPTIVFRREVEATGALVDETSFQVSGGGDPFPRLVGVYDSSGNESNIYLVYYDAGLGDIVARLDGSGSPNTIVGTARADGFDVCPDPAGTLGVGLFFLTWCETTTFRIKAGAANTTLVASVTVSVASPPNNASPGITYTSGGHLVVAWIDATAGVLYGRFFDSNLTATTAITTIDNTKTWRVSSQPVLCEQENSSGNTVVVAGNAELGSGGSTYYAVSMHTMTSAAAVAATDDLEHCRIASKPFIYTAQVNSPANDRMGIITFAYPYSFTTLQPHFQLWTLAAGVVDNAAPARIPGASGVIVSYARAHVHAPRQMTDGSFLWGAQVFVRFNRDVYAYSTDTGFDVFKFWPPAADLDALVHPVSANGELLFTGAAPTEFDGARLRKTTFDSYPEILSIAESTPGALTPTATYSYRCVFELYDANGHRKLSAATPAQSFTLTGANATLTLLIQPLEWLRHFAAQTEIARIAIYRTLGNGTVYHWVADIDAYSTGGTNPIISYADTLSDATIAQTEILYTQIGNELDNDPAPAHRYAWAKGDRLMVGGLWNPYTVQVSKPYSAAKGGYTWSDSSQFTATLPDKVRGVAALDDRWIVFTASSVYEIFGAGPDEAGAGGLSAPRKLASDVGLLSQRSIVLYDEGLMFQADSERIYSLPRGGGPPQWVGQQVRDTLQSYPFVAGAMLKESDNLVAFACADAVFPTDDTARLILYDTRNNQWHVDELDIDMWITAAALYQGKITVAGRDSSSLYYRGAQESTAWLDVGSANHSISQSLETGDVRVAGALGNARIRHVYALGEYRDAQNVTLEVSTDSGQSWTTVGAAGNAYTWRIWSWRSSANKALGTVGIQPSDLVFKADGTKAYVANEALSGVGSIRQYSLSTAWDISTLSDDGVAYSDATLSSSGCKALSITSDGLHMYAGDGTTLYEYALSPAWDLTGVTYTGNSYAVAHAGVQVKDDGTKYLINDSAGNAITAFTMSTPYDISTSSAGNTLTVTAPTAVAVNDGGDALFAVNSSDEILEYTLSTAWDPSTATLARTHGQGWESWVGNGTGMFYRDGVSLYMVTSDASADTMYQFDIADKRVTGDPLELLARLPAQKATALRFRLTCADAAEAPYKEGVALHTLRLMVEPRRGSARVGSATRS